MCLANCIIKMLVLLIIIGGTAMPVVAEHYYCRLGAIPLQVSDSIVTVKFNPLVPQPSIETFAETVEGLDESFVPERHDGVSIYIMLTRGMRLIR